MKPNIEDVVWCKINGCVFKAIVYALGRESFIIYGYKNKYLVECEWKYSDYKKEWCFDLSDFDCTLAKIEEDYFEVKEM